MMNKPNPNTGIAKLAERHMSPEWRQSRDALKNSIRDTVAKVEKLRTQDDGTVRDGFGLLVANMGRTGLFSFVAEQPNEPGLYLGVREAKVQEVSRVVDTGFGKAVYFMRMPNFEPGHSPEIGEHAVQGGVEFEAGITIFPDDGTGATTSSIQIGSNDMAIRYQWTGDRDIGHEVHQTSKMQESQQWVDQAVAPNILDPIH